MDKADWVGFRDLIVGYEVDVANLVEKHKKDLADTDQIINNLQEQLKKTGQPEQSNKL